MRLPAVSRTFSWLMVSTWPRSMTQRTTVRTMGKRLSSAFRVFTASSRFRSSPRPEGDSRDSF